MSVDRKTPTTANYGATISGDDYANAVNEEVEALWARSCVWLDNVSGTNTITADADPTLLAYSRNNQYNFIPAVTNTGPATLAINGLAARPIRTIDGVALVGNELVAGRLIKLQDDGTLLRIMNQPPSANAAISAVAVQTFTATGTYTPNSLMRFCRIRIVGPGGGGGGADNGTTGNTYSGGGGGGGEYAEGFFDLATIGASKAVTIGAVGAAGNTSGSDGGVGGTTSVGSLITAAGGGGGGGAIGAMGTPGVGGTGGTGGHLRFKGGEARLGAIVVIDGGTGDKDNYQSQGGPSHFGFGNTTQSGTDVTGTNGQNYGVGGNPGQDDDGTGSAGGTGGPSIVIIEEYLRAA